MVVEFVVGVGVDTFPRHDPDPHTPPTMAATRTARARATNPIFFLS